MLKSLRMYVAIATACNYMGMYVCECFENKYLCYFCVSYTLPPEYIAM